MSTTPAPTRRRALTALDVRHYGAYGDGAHNDTRAIACALEALGPRGGTVLFPPGIYPVVPSTLVLPSGVKLASSEPGTPAQLAALPSSSGREWLLLLAGTDHEICDLNLIGNRTDGLGTEDERGHGIYIQGARNVTLARLRIERCWGDGISVGASATQQGADDIWIEDVISVHNRRQGMSIGRASNVRVLRGSYSLTGDYTDADGRLWPGTAPQSGIDIEPDAPGEARRISIWQAAALGNDGYGIQVYRRSRDGGHSYDVEIDGCEVQGNSVGITAYGGKESNGATTPGVHGLRITNNHAHDNRSTGIRIETGVEDYLIEGNRMGSNYGSLRVRETAVVAGAQKLYESDLLLRTGTPASTGVVGENTYLAQP